MRNRDSTAKGKIIAFHPFGSEALLYLDQHTAIVFIAMPGKDGKPARCHKLQYAQPSININKDKYFIIPDLVVRYAEVGMIVLHDLRNKYSLRLNFIFMVTPKDLRIGNKLAFTREGLAKDFVTVNEISDATYWVEIDGRSQSKLEGGADAIPLSTDILDKCGFAVVNQGGDDQGFYNQHFLAGLYAADDGYTLVTEEGMELTGKGQIKYLHQLQNLFFALTGKELEVNLPGSANLE